ncbi:hypothetical protein HB943_08665 [Listeria weihenstephanensis]|uniref:Lipoprotein n=1 Tax=Listeria weihenstephanensis TaxID=1006155 RepID=A0A841Z8F3_9LIST|nr:hypothetical protein [Listeria weihenstephanensis]MBC1500676.1 hypothetical protein [Listeria weihenstephanensis]
MKKGIGIMLLGFVLLLAACGSNEKQAETSDKLTIQLDEKNVTADANDIFTVTGKATPGATISIGDVSVDANKKGKFELMHVYESDKSYEIMANKKDLAEVRATVHVKKSAAVKDAQKEQEQTAKDKAQKEVTENAKPNAAKISFAMLNGNPDKYARESYYLKGQVAEVIDGGATKYLKVNMTQDGGTWKDTVMVIYTGTTEAKKGAIVEVYGTIYGTYAFDDANGKTIAMPGITASSISVVE